MMPDALCCGRWPEHQYAPPTFSVTFGASFRRCWRCHTRWLIPERFEREAS